MRSSATMSRPQFGWYRRRRTPRLLQERGRRSFRPMAGRAATCVRLQASVATVRARRAHMQAHVRTLARAPHAGIKRTHAPCAGGESEVKYMQVRRKPGDALGPPKTIAYTVFASPSADRTVKQQNGSARDAAGGVSAGFMSMLEDFTGTEWWAHEHAGGFAGTG